MTLLAAIAIAAILYAVVSPTRLTAQDMVDLGKNTQNELGRLKFTQIATRLQRYECFGRAIRSDKVVMEGGIGIQRSVMVDHSGAAKMVGLNEPDDIAIGDVMQTFSIPWRHSVTSWAYERRADVLMNRGAARIQRQLQIRRLDGLISMAEMCEPQMFGAPTSSADTKNLYGIPYWLVKNAAQGFNGGNATAAPNGPGGLSHSRFKNWTDTYNQITKPDAVSKMRLAHRKIRFRSPTGVNNDDYRNGTGDQFRIYVGEQTIRELEDVGEGQNENLGRDIAPYGAMGFDLRDGEIVFRKNPIIHVPYLDSDTSYPIMMINWDHWNIVVLEGDYLEETEPLRVANKHNTYGCFIDLTWNMICTNRRENAILYKV